MLLNAGLYVNSEPLMFKDEANADFSKVDPYRGQNANMHACEAALWAYEATGNKSPYLDRAEVLVNSVTRKLTSLTTLYSENLVKQNVFCSKVAGFIWEHYDKDWKLDYDYNKVRQSAVLRNKTGASRLGCIQIIRKTAYENKVAITPSMCFRATQNIYFAHGDFKRAIKWSGQSFF